MSEPLLSVRNLKTYFPIKSGLLRKTVGYVHAVEDISFDVNDREVLAIVGESGCGKSTAGSSILRLIEPTGGNIVFDGADIRALTPEEMRVKRRDMQFIFQNPYGSLNPRMNVRALLSEPLRVHFNLSEAQTREQVDEMLELVGMTPDQLTRYPHQFSGGQKQRVSIARALISRPRFVVADEPVSALDVSIQAQILNLLMRLQRDMRLSMIFISHDLNVVRHISANVCVMYLGRIMEQGNTALVYDRPLHPYTQALLSAVPSRDPLLKKRHIALEGDVPNPANPPDGCPFHTRCARAKPLCSQKIPEPVTAEEGHVVACHLYDK
ncbi:MAG: dipeptide ABC transporter ATP-binding protein [Oscillospiraceae bacterium]|jgi:oligopeptide/dipeptide ABC transporter ATP-binding protein|nr:dipeptide ABC transporter ATP-binding protein [Oscillospiraceae bacterium]